MAIPLCRFDGRCTNAHCKFQHSKARPSSSTAPPTTCSFYLRGNCKAGASCKFSHVIAATPATPSRVCSFFLKGTCTRGNSCQFSHDSVVPPPAPAGAAPVVIAAVPARVCSFFLKGSCTNQNCRFLHEGTTSPPKVKVAPAVAGKDWRGDLKGIYDGGVGEVFSIDVECVASGRGHRDRVVGRIAMVDSSCNLIYDTIVNPELDGIKVVSYIERLTGLNKEICDSKGITLSAALAGLKEKLPSNALLVGQGIHHDIEWLDLKQGVDFARHFDIADMFKLRVKDKVVDGVAKARFRFFSLRHTVIALMGVDMQSKDHNPVDDAAYSLRLFLKYKVRGGEERSDEQTTQFLAPLAS